MKTYYLIHNACGRVQISYAVSGQVLLFHDSVMLVIFQS